MANNVTLSAGTADGAVIATDDIGSVHYQYQKIGIGADDTFTILVGGTGTDAAGVQRVSLATNVALPAGTNAIGKLASNSGVTIGAVEIAAAQTLGTVTTVGTVSAFGISTTGPMKAEDVASADGDMGIAVWAIRDDTLNIRSGTEGDYEPFHTDANGALWVRQTSDPVTVASHAVTNAGTFPVQVDGAALTALQLIDDVVYVEDVAAQAADKGISVLAVRRDTPTALATTDNDYIQLTTNSTGHLWVAGPVTVASGGVASGAIASGAVASGAVASGAFASGALAAGSIAAGAIADMIVDDAAFTPAASRVMMSGFQADESSTDSVDEGDAGAARMTLDRKVITTLQPHTAGGLSIFNSIDLDETEEDVKTSAGQVYSITAFNRTAAPLYLRFYNATAANTTVGSTAAHVGPFLVPANADSDGAGFVWNNDHGFAFDTAISAAVTTGIAANDTGAPGANDCLVVVGYK